MIIDAHAHLNTPLNFFGYRTFLEVANGHFDNMVIDIPDEELKKSADHNVSLLDEVGTDMQLLSPRPFALMHSSPVLKDIKKWVAANNNLIAKTVAMHPTRFSGIAGLPQCEGQPVNVVFDEIDRCINELGFIGVLLNPDPSEGRGTSPTLGNEYWYPLWEKLVAEDIPAVIHSTASYGRENYSEHFISEESLAIMSIANSNVFKDFPQLKIMISHGGGSVPYQIGRWRVHRQGIQAKLSKSGNASFEQTDFETFDDTLRRFWFDTTLYSKSAIELLLDTVGPDRCLFGTERPGDGSAIDPRTGRAYDDLKPVIESIEFLNKEDKFAIFEGNARKFFSRLNK
jgi:4-oxalmesaconate hydratase